MLMGVSYVGQRSSSLTRTNFILASCTKESQPKSKFVIDWQGHN